jgi:hypothetical protein
VPKFLVTRTVPNLTKEEIDSANRRDVAICREMGTVRWIKSYHSAMDGKFYCEYEAPSIEDIYEHARRAQLPVDSVSMISGEFDASMFK